MQVTSPRLSDTECVMEGGREGEDVGERGRRGGRETIPKWLEYLQDFVKFIRCVDKELINGDHNWPGVKTKSA